VYSVHLSFYNTVCSLAVSYFAKSHLPLPVLCHCIASLHHIQTTCLGCTQAAASGL
jgi:hypothetical protein